MPRPLPKPPTALPLRPASGGSIPQTALPQPAADATRKAAPATAGPPAIAPVTGVTEKPAAPRIGSPRAVDPAIATPRIASPRIADPRIADPKMAAPQAASIKTGPARFAPVAPASPVPLAAAAPPLRPPVRKAGLRLRHHMVLLSFLLCVLLPPVGAATYLWTRAADQFASKMGFAVRREESNSALDILGGLTSLSGSSSSSDTDILFEFIQSQKLVTDIDKDLDLRTMWSKPDRDPVFALVADAPLEDLVDYWNDMVRLSRGKGPGLLEVEVRAFDPGDANAIASLLFKKSAEMINDLSAIAREDAIRYAREDLDEAVERLKTARAAITRFRNVNQLVNPEMDIQSQAGLLNNLRAQEATTLIDIDLLRDATREGDPRLVQAERRLEVIEARIVAERDKLGLGASGKGSAAMADIIGEYERLVVDREFAQSAYIKSLATYDGAQADARRISRYLAAYMEPTLAETAQYPRRLTLLAMGSLFLFLIWSIVVLIYYSVRDRR